MITKKKYLIIIACSVAFLSSFISFNITSYISSAKAEGNETRWFQEKSINLNGQSVTRTHDHETGITCYVVTYAGYSGTAPTPSTSSISCLKLK
jgi:hypothetical protein